MQIADMHLLVAEDHDLQRGLMVRMLRGMGARHVSEAADGRAALAAFESDADLDLVICDVDMPEMDGMELIRHLGESGRKPSLILASALDSALLSSVGQMARARGMHLLGSVEKPATPEKLMPLLSGMVAQARAAVVGRGPELGAEDLRAALRGNQIEAFLQPKVELATGRVVGAEALARWRHPVHGLVPPVAFIGLAESCGEIDALTWAVLRSAARACVAWRAQGLEASVAVNLSAPTMARPGTGERILEIVREEGLPPAAMVLEVTESMAVTDVAAAIETLARLRMRGFGLSIDDFGTGHSSLQQLSRLPFSELKIDASFVRGASAQPKLRAILESGIAIAQRLKLRSVAEGLETRDDWDLLVQLGCDVAQGYFVARPMPAADFPAWAEKWSAPV